MRIINNMPEFDWAHFELSGLEWTVYKDSSVTSEVDLGIAGYYTVDTSLDELRQFIAAADEWLAARAAGLTPGPE